MFPMGHAAFAYLVYTRIARGPLTAIPLALLVAGAVFPTVVNESLQRWPVFSIHPLWSHSLVTLAAVWAGWVLIRFATSNVFTTYWFAFAVGLTTHLLSDIPFEFAHLYFSILTNEAGTPWLFPFDQITLKQPRLEPGYFLLPWQLMAEGLALVVATAHWWASSQLEDVESFVRTRLWPSVFLFLATAFADYQVWTKYPDPR